MQFILTGFTQDLAFRVFAFERMGLDRVRTKFVVRADLARLRATHTGGFVSSVLYDAGLIREAATTGLVNFIQQGLTLIAAPFGVVALVALALSAPEYVLN